MSKAKANLKILTHEEIKPQILEAARKVDREIVDIQEVKPLLRMKIHQISLEEHMAFRHDINRSQEEIYQASGTALGQIGKIIEAESGVTVHNVRWIRSVNHYIQEAQS